ncbi:MAG: histidinol-phosphate transaminase [Lachnospiraceae bacterium]|nr:histidinol-phosphate transaminase [Lachnospiraceae bacterium]
MGFESCIRRVVPYVPGEQPKSADVIKLNTNENPYPPSPRVREAIEKFDADTLRLYPDPAATDLIQAIAEEYGLGTDEVFAGVGSDDVLAMCFLTFFNSKDPVLFPDITYSFYDVWADLFRIPYEQIPLDDDFHIVPEMYRRKNGGIIFPNPNAPTGSLLPLETVRGIVAGNPDSIVIVDEAYIDFGGESALPLIREFDNLLVVQTFSKSRSGAGLRIGYAFGCPMLIRYLNDVKYSFNSYTMNRMVIEAGAACVRDRAYFRETTAKIVATRERILPRLREIGFRAEDSASNFVFASHAEVSAEEIFTKLRERGIYVRWWNKPRISDYLRITIGTDDEMDALIHELEDICSRR